jgi:hypothetical protein
MSKEDNNGHSKQHSLNLTDKTITMDNIKKSNDINETDSVNNKDYIHKDINSNLHTEPHVDEYLSKANEISNEDIIEVVDSLIGTKDTVTCKRSNGRVHIIAHCGTYFALDINMISSIVIKKSSTFNKTLVLELETFNGKQITFYTRNKPINLNSQQTYYLKIKQFKQLVGSLDLEFEDFSHLD